MANKIGRKLDIELYRIISLSIASAFVARRHLAFHGSVLRLRRSEKQATRRESLPGGGTRQRGPLR